MGTYTLSPSVQNVVFNGNEADKVVLNGTTVWEKSSSSDYIKIIFDAAGTATLANLWSTPILYSFNGASDISMESNGYASIAVSSGSELVIKESTVNSTFRSWIKTSRGFISGVSCHITEIPSMNRFTTDEAGTIAGNNFFYKFNQYGSITSLPAGSFDISNITSVGDYFFYDFNYAGALTSLPSGSFDTSSITTTVGSSFFEGFNYSASITSLPAGSFDISNITSVGSKFFEMFNYHGALTSLPAGSFDTSSITTVGDNFFDSFNNQGSIAFLPAGSFNTSNITSTSKINAFRIFNGDGGRIPKSTTSYNSNFINCFSSVVTAHYWNGSSSTSETVAKKGGQFYFLQQ